MTLLADMKTVLRVTTDALDSEVQMLIDAALSELERVGVDPDLLDEEKGGLHPLVRQAVAIYCKEHFGYDNAEAPRFSEAFMRVEVDLMNSASNIAAKE